MATTEGSSRDSETVIYITLIKEVVYPLWPFSSMADSVTLDLVATERIHDFAQLCKDMENWVHLYDLLCTMN